MEYEEESRNLNSRAEIPDVELKKIDNSAIEWINGDLEASSKEFPKPEYEIFRCLTPTELFDLFIDDNIISFLVLEANKYAQFKDCPNPNITNNEMKCFFINFDFIWLQ